MSISSAFPADAVAAATHPDPYPYYARLVAEAMSKQLGQQVIVENIGGAGGTIGTGKAATAAADGYTLLLHQVGLPIGAALYKLNYDVTRDLAGHTRRAEILAVAAGRPAVVTGDMVRPDAVVVDVGVNRLPDGKLAGDVDFPSVRARVRAITPVPGGVGPMTIAMLMRNTLDAARRQSGAA